MSVLPQTSLSIKEKADRLLLEGNVTVVAYAAMVQGDHGLYAVRREGDRWRCACPARKRCSHIEAVERVTS